MSEVCMLCLGPTSENTFVRIRHGTPECSATVLCCACFGTLYERNGIAPEKLCMVCSVSCNGPRHADLSRAVRENTHAALLKSHGVVGTDAALEDAAKAVHESVERMHQSVKHELAINPRLKRKWKKLVKLNYKTITDSGKARSMRRSTIMHRYARFQTYSENIVRAIDTLNKELDKTNVVFRV